MGWVVRVLAVLVGVGALAACTSHPVVAHRSSSRSTASSTASTPRIRRPAHIVVVVMENRSYAEIVHNRTAPYLNELLEQSASYSDFHAEAHPSLPNYLALFSGSTHRLRHDRCHLRFRGESLADEVLDAGLTYTSYAESLPRIGYAGCAVPGYHRIPPWLYQYVRVRAPWTDFSDIPADLNQPFTSFPRDYSRLPVLSFVIPNLQDSMHSASVSRGDRWLGLHIGAYATWARTHDSWLVITWDEDDHTAGNHIPTIITGAGIVAGTYSQPIDHYDLLRTIEVALGVPAIGSAAHAAPISGVIVR
jgi:acid phosphatase